jgi:hypothetical protein
VFSRCERYAAPFIGDVGKESDHLRIVQGQWVTYQWVPLEELHIFRTGPHDLEDGQVEQLTSPVVLKCLSWKSLSPKVTFSGARAQVLASTPPHLPSPS